MLITLSLLGHTLKILLENGFVELADLFKSEADSVCDPPPPRYFSILYAVSGSQVLRRWPEIRLT